jgi:hypothetical protein
MNEALITLAAMVDLIYSETSRIAMDGNLDDKAYLLLREAGIDAINLRQKILDARGWNITAERAKTK